MDKHYSIESLREIAGGDEDFMAEVPHHLYDYVPVTEEWSIRNYMHDFKAVIENMPDDQIPLLVGGTNYFVENVMFAKEDTKYDVEKVDFTNNADLVDADNRFREAFWHGDGDFPSLSPEVCHKLLCHVDPPMGKYLHVNDTRRVLNSLRKYY